MTTTWGSSTWATPAYGSASCPVTKSASTADLSRKLMKPGPAISGGSHRSSSASRSTMDAAISRGGLPSDLARRRATFDWK